MPSGNSSTGTRVLRATKSDRQKAVISSNQKQKAGCFGSCLCVLGLIGPTLIIFAITYMVQDQVGHGREPKVERYNAAVDKWTGGGEAELGVSIFTLTAFDGRALPMALASEAVPLGDTGDDLPDPPSQPSHVFYTGAGTADPPLLTSRVFDLAHRSRVDVTAEYWAGTPSTISVEFATFKEATYRASKVACEGANGVWSGVASRPLDGDCRGRTAAKEVCAVIKRGGAVGAWELGSAPGVRPGCGVIYAPSVVGTLLSAPHSFTQLAITLRHTGSPYLTAAAEAVLPLEPTAEETATAAAGSIPPPWDFGPVSSVHTTADTMYAVLTLSIGLMICASVCGLCCKLTNRRNERRMDPDAAARRDNRRRANKKINRAKSGREGSGRDSGRGAGADSPVLELMGGAAGSPLRPLSASRWVSPVPERELQEEERQRAAAVHQRQREEQQALASGNAGGVGVGAMEQPSDIEVIDYAAGVLGIDVIADVRRSSSISFHLYSILLKFH